MVRSKAGTALAALREDLSGQAFTPGDPGYDQARTAFTKLPDRRPAVIARCADEADVMRAVRFGRELDLRIAVRGGGHGLAGALVDGALVVDLRRMRRVTVDPVAATVRAEGGATVGDVGRATRRWGRTAGGTRSPAIGVGGFVLGGGIGLLDRSIGLAVDNLLGVELVTAGSERVRAGAQKHAELFWALHGGGGNFGVATALTLRLRLLPRVCPALLLCRPRSGPAVIRAFREVVRTGPDRVSGAVTQVTAGLPMYAVLLTYAGDEADLRRLAAPLLALPHEAEVWGAEAYRLLDSPSGMRAHWSAECLTGLPDELVDVFCARTEARPVPAWSRHLLFPLGGAVAAGPAGYPVPYRDAAWVVHPFACWPDPADDERAVAWVRDACADVRPWSTGAVCLGLVGDEGPERVRAGLGAGNLLRLEKVKRAYDPDNVFRFNHNIRPV
ncbi:FAD/FMN-containing dehydrogenase [Streptomyces griseochromogenes]|uniref:FAD-binding protein n=1 Tax=Streptomyces griseochromogenes TaxID=68214 RepID=A0A1B1B5T8_9ACTN|nr:FAD-binding protein [Streptomyces griseochromogenes]ANP54198.1 FAD-binding protein [Streptomyces griseochromogenes]MBP2052511.1 FAD/FMN-containing dehydrogenase [Streptomyces griseochromogenes]